MTDNSNPFHPSWADLNAYVDGELSSEETAAVAAAVASDSELAQEVARLTRLKWALQAEVETAPAGLLAESPPRSYRPLLAASLALLILAGGTWTAYQQLKTPSAIAPDVLLNAARIHTQWVAGGEEPDRPEAARLLSAVHDFGHALLLPDFSDNQLHVASVTLSGEAGEILHIGYRGTRGCHVSLLAFRDAELPAKLRQVSEGQDGSYLWKAGRIGYVLLAEGMSGERMAIIAEAAEEATRKGSRISPETRTALVDSRARSEPCLG